MKEALVRMKDTKEKNLCWQDGRLFEDKEDWIVDSCTKCTCQVEAPETPQHAPQHPNQFNYITFYLYSP